MEILAGGSRHLGFVFFGDISVVNEDISVE